MGGAQGVGVTPGWYGLVPGSQYVGEQYTIIKEMGRTVIRPHGTLRLKAYGEELDYEDVLKGVADCVATLETARACCGCNEIACVC